MPSAEVCLPILSIVAIYTVRMFELRKKRSTESGPVRETLTLRLFVATGTLMLIVSLLEFGWRGWQVNWSAFAAGWSCALASFWIRRRAIAALGRFWSLHVEIRENHQFVRSGPFRWVRHPTYLSMILELLACGLILRASWSLGLVSLLFVPALVMRLKLEEEALVGKFGDAYRAYQRATPALFPYKWPSS